MPTVACSSSGRVEAGSADRSRRPLERYLKRDRIPAVVRRPAPGLGGASLVELVSSGRAAEALELTRRMFAFTDAHA